MRTCHANLLGWYDLDCTLENSTVPVGSLGMSMLVQPFPAFTEIPEEPA
jgi:hypothetical protein